MAKNKKIINSNRTKKRYLLLLWFPFLTILLTVSLLIFLIADGRLGNLPSFEELENPQNALASEVFTSDGVLLGKYYIENRSNINFEDLSPNLVNALIATEDIRFYEHSGIDIRGLMTAIVRTLKGNQSGASTITQQLAKNLFHHRHGSLLEKLKQKLLEWFIAIKLEKSYTKEEIIANYFNTVPFGENSFGIKAAANTYFSTTPDSLTIEEAATLVGMLKATTYFNPKRNPKSSMRRRNIVLTQMTKYNFISKEVADSLKQGFHTLKIQYS